MQIAIRAPPKVKRWTAVVSKGDHEANSRSLLMPLRSTQDLDADGEVKFYFFKFYLFKGGEIDPFKDFSLVVVETGPLIVKLSWN